MALAPLGPERMRGSPKAIAEDTGKVET